MYETTQEFVAALRGAGELKTIGAGVSPVLEITELADRESKSPAPALPGEATRRTDPRFHHLGGKALLFENVEGSDIPVVINQFGSYRRMEMALGCQEGGLESLAARLGRLVKPEPPPTLLAKLKKIPELMEIARLPPRRVTTGMCQQVVKTGGDVDLRRLPMIRCWPHDGDFAAMGYPPETNSGVPGVESGAEWERSHRGRYVTLAGIHTIHWDDLGHPSPPSRNIGMYRVQLLGKKHMAMHWHMHHDGARHWRSWRARGERMPVAIALGGESVLPYAATAPMPPGISELLLAGFLNKGAIAMVPCRTVPVDVPANSEIVIEGWVSAEAGMPGWDPRRADGPLGPGAVFEGPFGDHTGFYSLPDRYPLLEVTAITHRRDPVYPTTVVGLPPQEDYFMGKATERLFLPLLKTIIPDIIDYDLPMFGAFHNCAMVQIRKEYPLQARRVMCAIWGAGQMSWTKTVVVVDEDVDVHDTEAVMRAVGERCVPGRDTMVVDGPLDILDHAAPYLGAGGKIGFDTTTKRDGEQCGGPWSDVGAREVPADRQHGERVCAGAAKLPGVAGVSAPRSLGGSWMFVRLVNGTRAEVDGVGMAIAEAVETQRSTEGRRAGSEDEGSGAGWGGGVKYVVLLGPEVDESNIDAALFHWCANFDPARDVVAPRDVRPGIRPAAPILIFDATPKREGESRNGRPCRAWPPIIRMPERKAHTEE